MSLFNDRRHAGQLLASALAGYSGRTDVLVLALPRGGVPVAYEVARRLVAPLDVLVVRKLGVPGDEELAMGALASGRTTSTPTHRCRSITRESSRPSRCRSILRLARPWGLPWNTSKKRGGN